jgi:DNA-binding NarL/FixJ family response regulator
MIRVVVADDQELIRDGLALMLDASDSVSVVGRAADGAEAIAPARRLQPDVVLMDVRMPRVDGIAATPRHRPGSAGDPRPGPDHLRPRRLVLQALRAGAGGYLLEDTLGKR